MKKSNLVLSAVLFFSSLTAVAQITATPEVVVPVVEAKNVTKETTVTVNVQGNSRSAKDSLVQYEAQTKLIESSMKALTKKDQKATSNSFSVSTNFYGAVPLGQAIESWTFNGSLTYKIDNTKLGAEVLDELSKKGFTSTLSSSESSY